MQNAVGGVAYFFLQQGLEQDTWGPPQLWEGSGVRWVGHLGPILALGVPWSAGSPKCLGPTPVLGVQWDSVGWR